MALERYRPDRPFDLVFDSGCLHSFVGGSVASYKQQLLRWLAPGGDYVLEGIGYWLHRRSSSPRRLTRPQRTP